jgi:hypothetical protein
MRSSIGLALLVASLAPSLAHADEPVAPPLAPLREPVAERPLRSPAMIVGGSALMGAGAILTGVGLGHFLANADGGCAGDYCGVDRPWEVSLMAMGIAHGIAGTVLTVIGAQREESTLESELGIAFTPGFVGVTGSF